MREWKDYLSEVEFLLERQRYSPQVLSGLYKSAPLKSLLRIGALRR